MSRSFTATRTTPVGRRWLLTLLVAALTLTLLPSTEASAANDDYVPLQPERVLDTRDDTGDHEGKLGATEEIFQQVTDTVTVPTDAEAVAINVTAANPTRASHLRIWPKGEDMPLASSINFLSQNIGNMIIAEIGEDNSIGIYNHAGSVDVIVDVVGYVPAGADYVGLTPTRMLDTRDDTGDNEGKLGAGDSIDQAVIPAECSGSDAVAVNVTAANPTTASHLRVWPTDEQMPLASAINFRSQNIGNMIIAEVGTDDSISIYNHAGTVDVILDVVGCFPSASSFDGFTPTRVLDTRDETGDHEEKLGAGDEITQAITSPCTDPTEAVAINVTAANPTTASHLRVWPADETRPLASAINFRRDNIGNMLLTDVDGDGQIKIYNHAGTVDVILDVVGCFPAQP